MIYIIVIAVLILLIVTGLYNSLVRRKNDVENAFASIDAMLKKRYDLIPNLVETVKSYMKHEKELLNELTELAILIGALKPQRSTPTNMHGRTDIRNVIKNITNR